MKRNSNLGIDSYDNVTFVILNVASHADRIRGLTNYHISRQT